MGPNDTRITIGELEERLAVDRSTIWRWYRAGAFPEPHFVSTRRAWWLAEVLAWEAKRMALPREARRGAVNLSAARRAKP